MFNKKKQPPIDDRPECKVINLQQWNEGRKEIEKQKLLKQILERGNPLDRK